MATLAAHATCSHRRAALLAGAGRHGSAIVLYLVVAHKQQTFAAEQVARACSPVKYAPLVLAWLVCSGVMAALDMRRSGFPTPRAVAPRVRARFAASSASYRAKALV